MYFDESRSAQQTITDEIIFRGETYPINTQISARFETLVAELAYEYAFLRGEHYELAGSIGIHELTFKLQLTAAGQNVNQQLSGRADVNGPLPVIGLHYVWEFYPHWSLDAMFQFFALKFQQYDGNLQDYNATVFYMRFRPWPPAAGQRATWKIDLEPRSAYQIRGAARWQWQHAVSPTPALRYSITFRTRNVHKPRRQPSEEC